LIVLKGGFIVVKDRALNTGKQQFMVPEMSAVKVDPAVRVPSGFLDAEFQNWVMVAVDKIERFVENRMDIFQIMIR
jgi:hypothetical protein